MREFEDKTPLEQRYLWFEGKVDPKSLALVRAGLPERIPSQAVILFVGFSYADIPLGKCFEIIFPKGRAEAGIRNRSCISAVTQQWGKPFDVIPNGWKTICVVEFPDGVPQMIEDLPTVEAWYCNRDWVCICDEPTWSALKAINATGGI
jgi:hypothetical protein